MLKCANPLSGVMDCSVTKILLSLVGGKREGKKKKEKKENSCFWLCRTGSIFAKVKEKRTIISILGVFLVRKSVYSDSLIW